MIKIRASTGFEPVTSSLPEGSNPVEALFFFFRLLLSNCLNWKIHCDDHSSLSSITAVQIWIISYTSHQYANCWTSQKMCLCRFCKNWSWYHENVGNLPVRTIMLDCEQSLLIFFFWATVDREHQWGASGESPFNITFAKFTFSLAARVSATWFPGFSPFLLAFSKQGNEVGGSDERAMCMNVTAYNKKRWQASCHQEKMYSLENHDDAEKMKWQEINHRKLVCNTNITLSYY